MAGTSVEAKLHMSLDDIIADQDRDKRPSGGPIRRGHKSGSSPYSRKRIGSSSSSSSYPSSRRYAGRQDPTPGRKVYVGNLDYRTSWQDLKDHMRPVGQVLHAEIMHFPDGKSKGCGLVEFATPGAAKRAIDRLTDTQLGSRMIWVREDMKDRGFGGAHLRGSWSGVGAAGGRRRNTPSFAAESFVATKIREEYDPDCQIYIGNIPYATEWQDVKDMCKGYGNVIRADVPKNERGLSKGFALVVFEDGESANKCIEGLNGKELEGREISVRHDNKQTSSSSRSSRSSRSSSYERRSFSSSNKDSWERGESGGNCKIYVGNLPFDSSWQDLKDTFKPFGRVLHADIIGSKGGSGTVEFSNHRDASRAIREMNDVDFGGRTMHVRWYD